MAYEFTWTYTYLLVMGMMLAAMLVVVLTFCQAPTHKYHLPWGLLPDAILLTVATGALCYILVYGKTYDWFSNTSMGIALAVMLVCGGLFLWLSAARQRKMLELGIFRRRTHGMA